MNKGYIQIFILASIVILTSCGNKLPLTLPESTHNIIESNDWYSR